MKSLVKGAMVLYIKVYGEEKLALKRLPVPPGMSTQHVLQHNKELAALRYEFVHLHDWIWSELLNFSYV